MKQLKQLQRKPRNNSEAPKDSNHDLRDAGAMLCQLSYKASLEAGQARVEFIPVV